eukprot:scaffold259866_cov24-Tisochrysis_lutea.AAC.1
MAAARAWRRAARQTRSRVRGSDSAGARRARSREQTPMATTAWPRGRRPRPWTHRPRAVVSA